MPARLNPDSPGLKGLVEAARNGEFEPVRLIARERLQFGEVWLEPCDGFHCGKRLAAYLVDEGLAKRIADPS